MLGLQFDWTAILQDSFCKPIQQEKANLQVKATNDAKTISQLQANLTTAKGALAACGADKDVKNKTITQQAKTIETLSDQVIKLTSDLERLPGSIFQLPQPAMLQQADPKKVMLGQFIIKTASATLYINYPQHSALFQPCPWFERILNGADCNRPRPDLTPIEICKRISNVFQRSVRYSTDQSQWGILDNWTLACIVYALGTDDCESSAAAHASAMIYYQLKFGVFKDYTVSVGLGHLRVGSQNIGHGFVCIWHNTSTDVRDSYIIEATLEYEASPKTMLEARLDYAVDWGVICYARYDDPVGAYTVRDSVAWWGTQAVGARGQEYSLVNRLKRVLTLEPSPKKLKHDHLRKIWQDKRRKP